MRPMSPPSSENQAIGRTAIAAFGGKPKITRFWDEAEKSHVDILECFEAPQPGVTSYATIGLSDAAMFLDQEEFSARVEVVGACESSCEVFANAMSTVAFSIINSGWFCAPGVIFPDMLSMYDCSSTMKHLMFVPPFLWEEGLKTLRLDTKTVAWLLAIPVSEKEFKFAEAEGPNELEALFERHRIDIFDINRPSILA